MFPHSRGSPRLSDVSQVSSSSIRGLGEMVDILAAVATVAGNVVVDVCHSRRACAIGFAPSACHELWLLRMATAGVVLIVDFAHCGGSYGCR